MSVHKLKEKELSFVASALEEEKEKLEDTSAIGWDGNNLIIRIPKDVANYLKLNKENRFSKRFQFNIQTDINGNMIKDFDIIERMEPKKQNASKKSRKINK